MPSSTPIYSTVEMLVDVEQFVGITHPTDDGKLRHLHVYPAADGWFNALLTPDEAKLLEARWFGEQVAADNYARLTNAE